MIGPQCHPGGVCGHGGLESGICFIGIAPGADEWRNSKKPFTGPSGRLLDAVLEAVGIKRDQVYTTNLLCWWKDAPEKADIEACAGRLKAELAIVKPKVVVLLGKIVTEYFLGMPFSRARGAVIHKDGIIYLATNHPAAALHRGATLVDKELQINAAYDLCRDLAKLPNLDRTWPEPNYTVVSDPVQAQKVLDSLPLDQPIAIDIETDYDKEYEKEHPFDHDITCIGLGTLEATVLTQSALPGLVWPDCQWLFHNGVFDTQEIARKFGVWLSIKEDTMLQSYTCDERSIRGTHKLKSLAREFCGGDFYEENDHKLDGTPESLQRLYEYNAKDVVYTYRLHHHMNEWQDREQTTPIYRELLLPGANMLARSQYRGIYVNLQHMKEITDTFGAEYYALKDELAAFSQEVLGFPEFNLNSPKQIRMMLEFQGYTLSDTRKATLQDMLDSEDIPFIRKLLRYRTLSKLIKNYLVQVFSQIKYDGRVHPHAFLIGTVTGRLSYKDPAMQTLPKPKTVKDLGVIRKIFSATNDDYILLEADYAQIEAWLGAHFSEDPLLLEDLSTGDWHSNVATAMFNVTKDSTDSITWAFYRDAAKHINYGSMYGEEAQGLTRRPPIGIGCDLATAKDYLKKWRAHYEGFVAYQKSEQLQAEETGYIQTPFGRKRRFPLIVNDHQLRQAVNYKIQSTAGDYTLSSAIRLWPILEKLDTHLLFIEHDALYYELPKRYLAEVMQIIREEMERPPLPGLPSIKTEIDIGPNLAQLGKQCPKCKEWSFMDKQCWSCGYTERA